jgi:hypothetical protein
LTGVVLVPHADSESSTIWLDVPTCTVQSVQFSPGRETTRKRT